jgi:hypothetical protein
MSAHQLRPLALTLLVTGLACTVVAVVAITAGSSSAGRPTQAAPVTPHFVGDAETGLAPWPSLENAHATRVVRRPHIQGRHGYRFRVTPDQVDASVDGDMAYLDQLPDRPWEQEDANTWYRFRYAFPSGTKRAFPGSFKPNQTSSGWNMVLEWHEPGCCEASPYLGVRFSGRGALMLRWVGGPRGASTWVLAYDGRPLKYDHWYDMLVHVRWSADPSKGFVEWWADGRKVFPTASGRDAYGKPLPTRFPTLWSVDGVAKVPWLEWGQYRGHAGADWVDTTYGDGFRIGPTRASVRREPGTAPSRS